MKPLLKKLPEGWSVEKLDAGCYDMGHRKVAGWLDIQTTFRMSKDEPQRYILYVHVRPENAGPHWGTLPWPGQGVDAASYLVNGNAVLFAWGAEKDYDLSEVTA